MEWLPDRNLRANVCIPTPNNRYADALTCRRKLVAGELERVSFGLLASKFSVSVLGLGVLVRFRFLVRSGFLAGVSENLKPKTNVR